MLIPSGWQAATYGATVNIDASLATTHRIVATNGTAFTIANPTNGATLQTLRIIVRNSSGGAMGVITWGGAFLAFPWTNPANGKYRTAVFEQIGGEYIYMGGSGADIG